MRDNGRKYLVRLALQATSQEKTHCRKLGWARKPAKFSVTRNARCGNMTASFRAFTVLVECSLEFGLHESVVWSKQTVVMEFMIKPIRLQQRSLADVKSFADVLPFLAMTCYGGYENSVNKDRWEMRDQKDLQLRPLIWVKNQWNIERHVANPAAVCWPIYPGAWREREVCSPNGTWRSAFPRLQN